MADNYLRRNVGIPIEEAGQKTAKAMDAEIDKLRKKILENVAAGKQYISPVNPFAGDNTPQGPKYSPQELEKMRQTESGLREEAMMAGPEIMAKAAQKLRDQAAIDQKLEEHANELENPMDMSQYKKWSPDQPAFQPPQPKFQRLQQQMQPIAPPPRDIRESLQGMVEVTPELEKQLGYGQREEDEEELKNARGSTRDTGTYGGI